MAVAAVPQNLVDELRHNILNKTSEKGPDSVHPKDLERVKKDDQWLRRFIAHEKQNIDKAAKMAWNCLTWRKEFKVNDINESNIKMDLVIKGAFFPHGKDIDDKTILILKCKLHQKGSPDIDEIKRCIVYWFERTERLTKGDIITIFFDMEGCGLSNMDLDLVKYIISMFQDYYPYFLNYIVIYEMAWILSAAFKIIKSWLPEEAINKIKMVTKKDVMNWVPPKHALRCWGGEDDYTFSFIPEEINETENVPNNDTTSVSSTRKVHFMEGSMPEQQHSADPKEDGPLKVIPSGIITFVREGNELVSTLELQNSDPSAQIAFKLKTTAPEKFRVKPSTGCLKPGAKDSVTVTLLPGFQLGGLSKDKFLVMSSIVDEKEVPNLDLSDLWKNTGNRKVFQTRLRCVQSGEVTRNGNVVLNHASPIMENDSQLSKLTSTLERISNNQVHLAKSIKRMQYIQIGLFFVTMVVGVTLYYLLKSNIGDLSLENKYCRSSNTP